MCCALCILWLWAEKTDHARPWAGLPLQVPLKALSLFHIAVDSLEGNGENIKLWNHRWVQGKKISELAPNLVKAVPKGLIKRRTVAQALNNRAWIAGIIITFWGRGAFSWSPSQILADLDNVMLQTNAQDQSRWKLSQATTLANKPVMPSLWEPLNSYPGK